RLPYPFGGARLQKHARHRQKRSPRSFRSGRISEQALIALLAKKLIVSTPATGSSHLSRVAQTNQSSASASAFRSFQQLSITFFVLHKALPHHLSSLPVGLNVYCVSLSGRPVLCGHNNADDVMVLEQLKRAGGFDKCIWNSVFLNGRDRCHWIIQRQSERIDIYKAGGSCKWIECRLRCNTIRGFLHGERA